MKTILGIIAAVALLLGAYAVSVRNSFVVQENGITAAYDANKATLDKVTQTIQGSGLATKQYSDLVIQAINAAMTGRYGPNGSGAAMQWIKENQPNIDPVIFQKLQEVIAANYAEWQSAQVTLRDRDRVYENRLQLFPSNVVAMVFGFPRIDMATYERMIVTDDTNTSFQTGKMKGVNDLLPPEKK